MKKNVLIAAFSLFINSAFAQIFTQGINGAITITPKGINGKNNNTSNDSSNVALGASALISNTFGNSNIALGLRALFSNTTGGGNIASGYEALYSNTIGYNNIALGFKSLQSNVSGSNNYALGASALRSNTIGTNNFAIGPLAMISNTEGSFNYANGENSMTMNEIGNYNLATGRYTLYNNIDGSYNIAYGYRALYNNINGSENIAIGSSALPINNHGNSNIAIGKGALPRSWEGSNNIGIGSKAGMPSDSIYYGGSLLTGIDNTYIGSNIVVVVPSIGSFGFSNSTAIGANARIDDNNKVRIGDANVTVIEGQVAWSYPSDRRLKEQIIYTNRLGLDFITRLKTVSYNYISDKAKTRYDGFIAQDIEQVMKDLNVPFSGLKKSTDGTYSLAYSDFIMPLVNAVKELSDKVKKLEDINATQQTMINTLVAKIQENGNEKNRDTSKR